MNLAMPGIRGTLSRLGQPRAPARVPHFHALLGRDAWRRLPSAVQQRFTQHADAASSAITYHGCMSVRASWLGRGIAHLCRLIGMPVAPFVDEDVPVTVRVFDTPDGSGTVWERRYDFPGRAPVIVTSIKQSNADGTLVEALGAGLYMRLAVFERDGALHFLSTDYFFQFGSVRIPLPAWLPPGPTHVIHQDQGDGRFRFTMHTEHPQWGQTYWQSGLFVDCRKE